MMTAEMSEHAAAAMAEAKVEGKHASKGATEACEAKPVVQPTAEAKDEPTETPEAEEEEEIIIDASSISRVPALFEKGKRLVALNNHAEAIECLGLAAKIAEEVAGADAVEWAPLFFLYGRALAQNHIDQGGDLLEPVAVSRQTKESKVLSGDAAAAKLAESGKLAFEGDESEGSGDEEDDGEVQAEAGSEEDDLELAWSWIELARAAFERQANEGSVEARKQLGEVHSALADIQLENEKIPEAIGDYETALVIKRLVYPDDSRVLSHAYYKCGCAFEIDNRLDDAREQIEAAREVLVKRKANFERRRAELAAAGDDSKGKQPMNAELADVERELADLTDDLIPSIDAKIRELVDLQAAEAGDGATAAVTAEDALTDADAAAISKDIGDLVKKKHSDAVQSAIAAAERASDEDAAALKRKADGAGEVSGEAADKKAKLEQ